MAFHRLEHVRGRVAEMRRNHEQRTVHMTTGVSTDNCGGAGGGGASGGPGGGGRATDDAAVLIM